MLKVIAIALLVWCLIVCFAVVTQNVFIYILSCANDRSKEEEKQNAKEDNHI